MDWLILVLLVPLILIPIVFLCGFAGCGLDVVGTAVPQPPTNLVATAGGTDHINLSWKDNSTSASDFIIERGPPGGVLSPIAGLPLVKGVTFVDQPLPAGTTFLYQVIATWGGSNPSTPSNIASATTLSPSPPPPPPPPPPPVTIWRTVYDKGLTTNEGGWEGSTIVQRIDAAHLTGVGSPSKVRVTLRGSTATGEKLVINKVMISQAAAAGQAWNSAADLTELHFGGVSGVTILATAAPTLSDETNYSLVAGKDLIIAFDISPAISPPAGSARKLGLTNCTMYSKKNVTEAGTSIRTAGYTTHINSVYIVRKIEVL
jgi:hypothetical protein